MPQPGKPWLATREEVAASRANAQAEMRRRWDTDPTYRGSGVYANRGGRIVSRGAEDPTWLRTLDRVAVPAAIGLTGFGAASGLGLFGAGAGSGSAAAASLPSLPPVVSGLPAAGAGAAAGGMGTLGTALTIGAQAAPLFRRFFGGGGDDDEPPMADELRELLQLQADRMRAGQPLYDAIQRMALGMLPTSARAGFTR